MYFKKEKLKILRCRYFPRYLPKYIKCMVPLSLCTIYYIAYLIMITLHIATII